eukprot:4439648-Pleurochrysis_carterae.AAC.2
MQHRHGAEHGKKSTADSDLTIPRANRHAQPDECLSRARTPRIPQHFTDGRARTSTSRRPSSASGRPPGGGGGGGTTRAYGYGLSVVPSGSAGGEPVTCDSGTSESACSHFCFLSACTLASATSLQTCPPSSRYGARCHA